VPKKGDGVLRQTARSASEENLCGKIDIGGGENGYQGGSGATEKLKVKPTKKKVHHLKKTRGGGMSQTLGQGHAG